MNTQNQTNDTFSFGSCQLCGSVSLALKNGKCRKCNDCCFDSAEKDIMSIFGDIFKGGK